jgi:hypothetical protein
VKLTVHAYERSPHSGAGNCHCGWAEHSRVHPHPYLQAYASDRCVCAQAAGHAIHTDAATARPRPVRRGLDGVRDAVRAARGGNAPAQIRGYA